MVGKVLDDPVSLLGWKVTFFRGELLKLGRVSLDFTIDERFSEEKFVSNEKHQFFSGIYVANCRNGFGVEKFGEGKKTSLYVERYGHLKHHHDGKIYFFC